MAAQHAFAQSFAAVESEQAEHVPAEDEKARQWYDLGKSEYERGNYEAAITAFLASYELSREPILLFNVAQALRLNGKCDEADRYYERYRDAMSRATPPGEPPSDFEELWSEAKRCAQQGEETQSRVTSPPKTPAPRSTQTSPKERDGTELRRKGGRTATTPAWDWTRWTGVACVTVAVGASVGGTIFALKAHDAEQDTSRLSESGGTWSESARENESAGETASALAIGLFAGAAVSGATGLWLLLRPSDPRQSTRDATKLPQAFGTTLDISVSDRSASATLRAAF